jgi:hypothetical protein
MKHLLEVANIGYGYNRKESDYTVTLGKRTVEKPLTLNWFHGFMKRWPELCAYYSSQYQHDWKHDHAM